LGEACEPIAVFFDVTLALEVFLLAGALPFALGLDLDVFLTAVFAGVFAGGALALVIVFEAFTGVEEGASGFLVALVRLAAVEPAFSLETLGTLVDAFFGAAVVFFLPSTLFSLVLDLARSLLDLEIGALVVLEALETGGASSAFLGANLTLPDGPLGKTKICLSEPVFRAREIFETTDVVISRL